MTDKDYIKELFSKQFENHTEAVRPDLWAGVQAKMAAAGVASTGVAAKGLSAFAKWMIGAASIGAVGVTTTLLLISETPQQANHPIANQTLVQQTKTQQSSEVPVLDNATTKQSNTNEQLTSNTVNPSTESPILSDKQRSSIPQVLTEQEKSLISPYTPIVEQKTEKQAESKTQTNQQTTEKSTKQAQLTEKKNETFVEKDASSKSVDLVAQVTKFPNVFTPNGDGSNDRYSVEVVNIKEFRLTIINQQNAVVFETTNEHDDWNGYVSGELAPEGMYAAIVTGKKVNGEAFKDIQLFELKR